METRRENRLELLVESKSTAILVLLLRLFVLLCASHDTSLLVVTDALLEEVCLSSKGDVVHEVEGVGGVVELLVPKSNKQSVGDEFNVLAHELRVHSQESTRKGVSEELLLDTDRFSDDAFHNLRAWSVAKVGEKETGEISVETLITGDELVGEGETGHETTLLQPEDRREGSTEEDTLDSSKGDETLGEARLVVLDPADSPLSLLADTGNCEAC